MLNHISAQSPYYLDFEKKEESPYKDFFTRYNDYWPENRPTEADIDLIYKHEPRCCSAISRTVRRKKPVYVLGKEQLI